MKSESARKAIQFLAVFVALSGVMSCAMVEGRESGRAYVDDATISNQIRALFVEDPLVQATQVHVDTMQGTVELSGFVDSREAEERAVHIARQVNGVRSVRDEIVVR